MSHWLEFDVEHDYSSRAALDLTVTLRSDGLRTSFDASVDTGATCCVFKREIAETLRLDAETGIQLRISTATGVFTAYGHTLVLETLGIEFETIVYFAAHKGLPRNVLGRRGWLDRVRLGIIEYEAKLYVSPYEEP